MRLSKFAQDPNWMRNRHLAKVQQNPLTWEVPGVKVAFLGINKYNTSKKVNCVDVLSFYCIWNCPCDCFFSHFVSFCFSLCFSFFSFCLSSPRPSSSNTSSPPLSLASRPSSHLWHQLPFHTCSHPLQFTLLWRPLDDTLLCIFRNQSTETKCKLL